MGYYDNQNGGSNRANYSRENARYQRSGAGERNGFDEYEEYTEYGNRGGAERSERGHYVAREELSHDAARERLRQRQVRSQARARTEQARAAQGQTTASQQQNAQMRQQAHQPQQQISQQAHQQLHQTQERAQQLWEQAQQRVQQARQPVQQAPQQQARQPRQQVPPQQSRYTRQQDQYPPQQSRYSQQQAQARSYSRANAQNRYAAQRDNQVHTAKERGQQSTTPMQPSLSRRSFVIGGAVVGAAALLGVGGVAWANLSPVNININGQQVSVGRNASIKDAFEAAGSPATAGNLLNVEGGVLEKGGGDLFSATADGQQIAYADASTLKAVDYTEITFSNGADVEEESTVHESVTLPFETEDIGNGSLHIMTNPGQDGLQTTKTGNISGITVTGKIDQEPQNRVFDRCYADVGDDKVIALTFDDGPWDQTNEFLDVLKENDAKATFFVVGERITGDGVDKVKREEAEGHQVASHTWDHARGSGQSTNLSLMSADEQRQEVEKGFSAIAEALGHEPSHVMRAPGGNFPTEVWSNVCDLVDADIRWDIDTTDWSKPGKDVIVEKIMKATPGDIVLMHDGGGDRSQTLEALRSALPKLKKEGWRFITIDELRQYPTKEDPWWTEDMAAAKVNSASAQTSTESSSEASAEAASYSSES